MSQIKINCSTDTFHVSMTDYMDRMFRVPPVNSKDTQIQNYTIPEFSGKSDVSPVTILSGDFVCSCL